MVVVVTNIKFYKYLICALLVDPYTNRRIDIKEVTKGPDFCRSPIVIMRNYSDFLICVGCYADFLHIREVRLTFGPRVLSSLARDLIKKTREYRIDFFFNWKKINCIQKVFFPN